jgi:hypothetical protein
MGRKIIPRASRGFTLVPRPCRLFILAQLEQFQLSSQHQDFLLLQGQRIIEGPHGVFLEGDLALHLHHLLLEFIYFSFHFAHTSPNPCFRPGNRLIYCRLEHKDTIIP